MLLVKLFPYVCFDYVYIIYSNIKLRKNNKNGANEETLTLDLFLGKEAL